MAPGPRLVGPQQLTALQRGTKDRHRCRAHASGDEKRVQPAGQRGQPYRTVPRLGHSRTLVRGGPLGGRLGRGPMLPPSGSAPTKMSAAEWASGSQLARGIDRDWRGPMLTSEGVRSRRRRRIRPPSRPGLAMGTIRSSSCLLTWSSAAAIWATAAVDTAARLVLAARVRRRLRVPIFDARTVPANGCRPVPPRPAHAAVSAPTQRSAHSG
jgi:hypothetical protein